MAIAKNIAKGTANSGTTTFTVTSLNCTGSDRVLIVAVTDLTNTSPTGVTFNTAENLTKIADRSTTPNPDGSVFKVTYWALIAPTSTTANVVVTFAGNANAAVVAQCFTGVNQTTPYGAESTVQVTADSGGAQPSLTVTGTAVNELCVVALGPGRNNANSARTPGTGVTEEGGAQSVSSYQALAIWTKAGAATSTVVDGSFATATAHRMIGFSLKPVGAATGMVTKVLLNS